MRFVIRLFRFVPASRLADVLGVSGASAWRYDRQIPSAEMPPPSLEAVEALLIGRKPEKSQKVRITGVECFVVGTPEPDQEGILERLSVKVK